MDSLPVSPVDKSVAREARRIWHRHIRPPRGLGMLEDLAIQVAAIQNTVTPRVRKKRVVVFCGDHGVAAEGVSALSQDVTRHLVEVTTKGRSAISICCRQVNAELQLIDLGVKGGSFSSQAVLSRHISEGTQNIRIAPAMTEVQYAEAFRVGGEVAKLAVVSDVDLLGLGEIGIANTTSASALMAALLSLPASETVGRGSGVSGKALARKHRVVEEAIALHGALLTSTSDCLRVLGGYEIVAMTAAILAGAGNRMVIVIDGFTASVAALAALQMCPQAKDYLIFSHLSGEHGHKALLRALGAKPILRLGMRLGEGTGSATCMPLIELGCGLLTNLDCF